MTRRDPDLPGGIPERFYRAWNLSDLVVDSDHPVGVVRIDRFQALQQLIAVDALDRRAAAGPDAKLGEGLG
jgi:hypothetical protein